MEFCLADEGKERKSVKKARGSGQEFAKNHCSKILSATSGYGAGTEEDKGACHSRLAT